MEYIIVGIVVVLVGSSLFLATLEMKKRGMFRSKNRDLDLAMVGLSQQIRRHPNDAKAHVKRGIVRFKKRDVKGALGDLIHAIELDDTDVEAHYHCGVVRHETGDLKGARKEFDWIRDHSEDPFYKTAVSERLQRIRAALSR